MKKIDKLFILMVLPPANNNQGKTISGILSLVGQVAKNTSHTNYLLIVPGSQ
jgi:hypothetical protein